MTKSTGRQQEKEERARRIVAGSFDEILRLVETGIPMVKAIRYVPGQPSLNSVRNWMRNNPDQWERFRAAQRKAYGSTGFSPYTPAAWDSALVTIATADEALSQINRQGEPNYDACLKRAARDPEFRVRFDAALAARNSRPDHRPARFSTEAYAEALTVIRNNPGSTMESLNAELIRRRLPVLGSIYSAKSRNTDIADQFAAISKSRGVVRYSAEAHAEALAILQNTPKRARVLLRREAGRLPSFNAIRSRALSNGEVAAAFEASRLARRTARAKAAAERRNRPQYRENVLRSSLLLDSLYREASALFHRGLPADVRDDLISDVVVAVLEGDLPRDAIKDRGAALGWARLRSVNGRQMDTLDRPVFAGETGSPSLGDLQSSDHWSFEDAI